MLNIFQYNMSKKEEQQCKRYLNGFAEYFIEKKDIFVISFKLCWKICHQSGWKVVSCSGYCGRSKALCVLLASSLGVPWACFGQETTAENFLIWRETRNQSFSFHLAKKNEDWKYNTRSKGKFTIKTTLPLFFVSREKHTVGDVGKLIY